MISVYIYLENSHGHYPALAITGYRIFRQLGCRTYFIVPFPSLATFLDRRLAELGLEPAPIKMLFPDSANVSTQRYFWSKVTYWRALKKVLDTEKIPKENQRVFFPSLEEILWTATLTWLHSIIQNSFPFSWAGIYITPINESSTGLLNSIKNYIFPSITNRNKFLSTNPHCKIIYMLHKKQLQLFPILINSKKLKFFPSVYETILPTRPVELIEKIQERARGRTIVSLVGWMDNRKGISEFKQLAIKCAKEPYFFVVYGNRGGLDPDSIAFLNQGEAGAIENVFVSRSANMEAIINSIIKISSIIYCVYHQSLLPSGIASKAYQFEKAILLSSGLLEAEDVQKYRIGTVVKSFKIDDIHAGLNDITNNILPYLSSSQFKELQLLNSMEKAQELLKDFLEL